MTDTDTAASERQRYSTENRKSYGNSSEKKVGKHDKD